MGSEYIEGDKSTNVNGELVSGYTHNAQTLFKELNQVSPSFCLAKWFNVSIHIPSGQTHSCYHPRSHQIPLEEVRIDVSALHNTKYKKEQRKLMLEGQRPLECNFCWETEDNSNSLSDRAYRSKDIYEPGIIEEAKRLGFEGNAYPRYVEVNFNQACNFRCTYCSPHLSTAWQQDIDRNGPYILSDRQHNDLTWVKKLNIDNSSENPYLKAFWKWLPDIYPTLHTFRMTGGEPLMDKNTFRMFEYVKDHPKKDLHLSITSNCCPPGDQWNKFMSGFKEIADRDAVDHFMLYCSLDSWGQQAEYIRDGLEFNRLYNNITEFLRDGKKHSLTFIITFNVLSYSRFHDYIKNILKLRQQYNTDRQLIWWDVPQLSSPEWMDPRMAPEMIVLLKNSLDYMKHHKETWENRFKGFNDFEIDKVQRLIDWIKGSTFNSESALKNFYLYFSEHDRRRGTDFTTTFPELNTLWKKSKKINGQ